MQLVATDVLSINISESESEFKLNDNLMNFTDSDHKSQFSEHNDDKKLRSHSDQNNTMTSGHSSSNIAPSQPVRSKSNPIAVLISILSSTSTPTDADF